MNAEFTKNLRELTPNQKAFFKAFPNLTDRIDVRMHKANKPVAERLGEKDFEEQFQKTCAQVDELFLSLIEQGGELEISVFTKKLNILTYFYYCFFPVNACEDKFEDLEKTYGKKLTFLTKLGAFDMLTQNSPNGAFLEGLLKAAENDYSNFRQILNDITLEELADENRNRGDAK